MDKKYIISLDQGTTSSRAVIFDKHGNIVGMKSKKFNQIFPNPGWVEHDPAEILESQLGALNDALQCKNIDIEDVSCIGIANQRETVVIWDKTTGKPIHNAIVWQCRRTSSICQQLKDKGLQDQIQDKTGLLLDSYFSGSKIKWLLDNVDGAREKADKGELLAGTIDTWLIWNLTGGRVHATDYSNASRTMLFNIYTLEWDMDLLKELDIPEQILPEVVPSSGLIGETDEKLLGISIPITGTAGDQSAALFGQACYSQGSAKNTYGTGCFILMNTGKKPVKSKNNLLTTIAWNIGDGVDYALEGSVFNAGSTIDWLCEGLGLIETPQQGDKLAESVSDTGGIYMVPAFTGLGAPYWDMYARGIIAGLTRGTRKEHIIRAVLEAIAYQSRDVFEAMSADSCIELKELRVDGGVSNSSFLMQFQADILGLPVIRAKTNETTALGAAYLAGLGTGIWSSKEEIASKWSAGRSFAPNMEKERREQIYATWKKAVERSMNWEAKQD